MDKLGIEAKPCEKQPEKAIEVPEVMKPVETSEKPVVIQVGIEETLEAVKFLTALAMSIKLSLEDKKITMIDALNFYEPAKQLLPFMKGIDLIPTEVEDMNDEEAQRLVQAIIDSNILPEQTEEIALDVFSLIIRLKSFIYKYFVKQ